MRDQARDEARASREFGGIERRVPSSEVLFAASDMGARLSRDIFVAGDIRGHLLRDVFVPRVVGVVSCRATFSLSIGFGSFFFLIEGGKNIV
jgi:hypothetical protein